MRLFIRVARKVVYLTGVSLVALAGAVPAAYCDTLYGITNDDNLISVNTANPTASTLIGTLDTTSASLGIFSNSGSLFVYDTDNNVLRQVNPTTAATVSTINIGIAVAPSEGDVAFQKGVGYLLSNLQPDGSFNGSGTLFQFTLSSGSATIVSTNMPLIDGLALSSTGNLFGLAQGGTSLYAINTSNGSSSVVGAGTGIDDNCSGFPCYGFGGLSFGSSGTLFATLTNFASPTSQFFTINPTTGAATSSGSIPFGQVTGITSLAPIGTAVPEPSTLFLPLVGCLFGIGRWKRIRRA